MISFRFWQRWLMGLGILLVTFGLAMALLNATPLFAPFDANIDPVFWPAGVKPAGVAAFQRWVYGVLGATVAGWGVFVYFLARVPFARREGWAWRCALIGILVWFTLDTGLSLAARVFFNVGLNVLIFVLVILPLAFT